jgi:hypothetical protein
MVSKTEQGFIIDTPEGIAFYRLCVHLYRLRVEVATGMRASGGVSTLESAQRLYGVTARTKAGAIVELTELKDAILAGEKSAKDLP